MILQTNRLAGKVLVGEIAALEETLATVDVEFVAGMHDALVVEDDAAAAVHFLLDDVLGLLQDVGEGLAGLDELDELRVRLAVVDVADKGGRPEDVLDAAHQLGVFGQEHAVSRGLGARKNGGFGVGVEEGVVVVLVPHLVVHQGLHHLGSVLEAVELVHRLESVAES